MLTLRDGSVAHQDDQASGRALLYAYIIDEIDAGADGGALLSRIERQCGSSVAYPNGDGVAALGILCKLAEVGDNSIRVPGDAWIAPVPADCGRIPRVPRSTYPQTPPS